MHAFFKALLFLGAGAVITALHHEQDIFRMGGLSKKLPYTFWPFLAGALCLAGVPLTGGFFSKDSILAAVWLKGGTLYSGLYLLGLTTAFVTSLYTFRLLYLVFAGESPAAEHKAGTLAVPRLLELPLVPLALVGLFGGLLNLPEFLGHGWLAGFLTPPGTPVHHLPVATELALQGAAVAACLAGFLVARARYTGAGRQLRLTEADRPASGVTAFLLHGWYVDDLYRVLFIRPYVWLAGVLWQRVDEGVIDASLDRLAGALGWSGQQLGRWTVGRVSVYLLSFAAGAALLLGWLVWAVLS
ncbi:MAG TPA: proton-conducting transporter membrane subunit [Geobacteraceae bacterium]